MRLILAPPPFEIRRGKEGESSVQTKNPPISWEALQGDTLFVIPMIHGHSRQWLSNQAAKAKVVGLFCLIVHLCPIGFIICYTHCWSGEAVLTQSIIYHIFYPQPHGWGPSQAISWSCLSSVEPAGAMAASAWTPMRSCHNYDHFTIHHVQAT